MEKKILLFVLLFALLPIICFAQSDVTLAWDCNNATITGYKVYRSQQSGIYDLNNPSSIIGDPNIRTVTHYKIPDGTYYWVVTAYREHIPAVGLPAQITESGYSNEVTANLLTSPLLPPDNNRITVIVNVNVNTP